MWHRKTESEFGSSKSYRPGKIQFAEYSFLLAKFGFLTGQLNKSGAKSFALVQ